MDLKEEMKTLSSTEEESEDTDEDIEHERRLQRALLEKDKVLITVNMFRQSSSKHVRVHHQSYSKTWVTVFRLGKIKTYSQCCDSFIMVIISLN